MLAEMELVISVRDELRECSVVVAMPIDGEEVVVVDVDEDA